MTQLLFRDATWAKLNEKVLTKIAQQFANKFSVGLTKKKLGQFVPVAGVLVGAGLNFALIDRIAAAANDAYRERFLIEKSGGTLADVAGGAGSSASLDESAISVINLLEEEGALPALDPHPRIARGAPWLTPRDSAEIPQETRSRPRLAITSRPLSPVFRRSNHVFPRCSTSANTAPGVRALLRRVTAARRRRPG